MEADGGVSLEHLSVLSLYFIALYLALPPVCTDPKAIAIAVLGFFSLFQPLHLCFKTIFKLQLCALYKKVYRIFNYKKHFFTFRFS